jgi:hypothetical protein
MQEQSTEHESPIAHAVKADEMYRELLELLREKGRGDPNETIVIPDTNALYAARPMQEWSVAGVTRFAVAVLPIIFTEIDRHKDGDHRNPAVVNKAKALVRQFREFRRRGRLTEGVPLVKSRSRVFAWAREPRPNAGLAWLGNSSPNPRLPGRAAADSPSQPGAARQEAARRINKPPSRFARLCHRTALGAEPRLRILRTNRSASQECG